MEDSHMLQDYGLTSTTAKAQSPATVGLAIRLVFTRKFENTFYFFEKFSVISAAVFDFI